MQKIKSFFSILLALTLISMLLAGCSSQKKKEQAVIGTCAGYDVLYEELRYVTLTYKDMFASTYGKDIWEDPATAEKYRAELEETVWDMMLNNYAVLKTAQYYMPEEMINDSNLEEGVDEQIQAVIDQYGGKSEFRKELKNLHMTEHFLRFVLWVTLLENELLYVLTDDLGIIENDVEAFLDWLDEGNFVCVQHIFISNDPGDDPAENLATIEDIRQQVLDGADFNEFVGNKVNEDLSNAAPYFLVRDVYVKELEDAAFDLYRVGDMSDVIETEDGYYLMMRMEYDDATLLMQAQELLTSYQWAKLEAEVNSYRADLVLELNEYGKSLDLLAIE
jgi:hypothetical protein